LDDQLLHYYSKLKSTLINEKLYFTDQYDGDGSWLFDLNKSVHNPKGWLQSA